MAWTEVVGNMHMHTPYSDGEWYHEAIAGAALAAGLDYIIVTDHNVWVHGPEGYRASEDGKKRVLVLVGEEVHDQRRNPQGNHLLIFGAERELARHAPDPQKLLDAAGEAGALTFLAHPFEKAAPLFDEGEIPWHDWEVTGFTGLEIWNFMSEFKGLLTSKQAALRFAFKPDLGICGPFEATLAKWDELLAAGRRVVAIGNSDAHGNSYRMGNVERVIFPYEFLFKAVNTHLYLPEPLSGDLLADRRAIYQALREGRGWVGYDLPAPTQGFRFSAQGERGTAIMGEEIAAGAGVTMQVRVPHKAELRVIHNGREVARAVDTNLTHISSQPGAYRVEARIMHQGQWRGWIFSNPIYLRERDATEPGPEPDAV
jgi:hypothetical protein